MSKEEIETHISRYFTATLTHEDENVSEYLVEPLPGLTPNEAFSEVYNALVPRGYSVFLFRSKDMNFLRVTKRTVAPKNTARQFIIMLVATLASVAATGYVALLNYNSVVLALNESFNVGIPIINPLLGTLMFVASVMTPLMGHELGHYAISKRAGVPVTYPLPIPAPLISPVGTFGAFIRSYHPPKDVRGLMLVGISGPLTGVLLSTILYVVSYITSPVLPVNVAQAALKENLITEISVVPSLTLLIDQLLNVRGVVLLSPMATSAWFLLLIHFANLLPIGQLDGGHVLRSLTNVRVHSLFSLFIILTSIFISILTPSLMWLGIFAVIAWVISGRGPHYGAANMISSLSMRDKAFFSFLYVLLILITFPMAA